MKNLVIGSVKNLIITSTPTKEEMGRGVFAFSDRHSEFDWGEMPDAIPEKGICLAMTGAYNFELLEKKGIPTHYIGLMNSNGEVKSLQELLDAGETSRLMAVKLTRKIPINNNYEQYMQENNNFLVPLEIIFRNGLPKGSSIFGKLEEAKLNPDPKKLEQILFSLGLLEMPEENSWLPRPVYDFSTKLEEQDRPLSYEDALRISGLRFNEFGQLMMTTSKVNDAITSICNNLGLQHWDGKIEVIKYNEEIIVADVCGTLDESRISRNGMQLSKQPLREYYKTTSWYKAVCLAKKLAQETKTADWKSLCLEKPGKLPAEVKDGTEKMYKAATNHWLGKKIFEVPQLDDALSELGTALKKYGV